MTDRVNLSFYVMLGLQLMHVKTTLGKTNFKDCTQMKGLKNNVKGGWQCCSGVSTCANFKVNFKNLILSPCKQSE